jgi:hypothetical protein
MKKKGDTLIETNIERDIGKILQELEQHSQWLKSIDNKATYTNGKIANTMQDLALIKQKQDTCPALLNHGSPYQRKNMFLGIGMFIIAIMNLYIILKGLK